MSEGIGMEAYFLCHAIVLGAGLLLLYDLLRILRRLMPHKKLPVALEDIVYWPGKFFNAAADKASADNERCACHMTDTEGCPWTMVQIAGLIARRIVCRTEAGDQLTRGQRFGLIRFGSRVDLYIPDEYSVAVAIGDQVFAGQTVVATKRASSL